MLLRHAHALNCRVARSWSKQTNYYACLTRAVHWEKPANPVQFGTVPATRSKVPFATTMQVNPQPARPNGSRHARFLRYWACHRSSTLQRRCVTPAAITPPLFSTVTVNKLWPEALKPRPRPPLTCLHLNWFRCRRTVQMVQFAPDSLSTKHHSWSTMSSSEL